LTDENEVPEPPAISVTRPGDLWILGGHRLLCGDATVSADVARLLGNVEPGLLVSDPPYGVDYDPAWREKSWRGARSTGKVQADDRADWREAWTLFPGDIAYVWHAEIRPMWSRPLCKPAALKSDRRLFGPNSTLSSPGAIITASMNRVGTRSARAAPDIGRVIVSRPRYGKSRIEMLLAVPKTTPPPTTAHRSRSRVHASTDHKSHQRRTGRLRSLCR
jgi:hypothetical protein